MEQKIEGDILLASIENKNLYLSDIAGLIPADSGSEDSLQVINAFAENWARETVVLLRAEKRVSENINIDKLVKNYRESLVINNFEQLYIKENLDTIVTKTQIEAFYNENTENFVCKEPLLKFWFAKIPAKKNGLDKFFERWKKNDFEFIENYCKSNAKVFNFSKDTWVPISEVRQFFPESLLKKIDFNKKRSFQNNQSGDEYFLKIFDIVKEGGEEPQSYIEEKLIKLILHKRKTEILDQFRETLYDEALDQNQINFFLS